MSEGYRIPFGLDFGDSLKELDLLISKSETAKKAASDAQVAYNTLNQTIVENGNKSNQVIEESAKATLSAKKAADERARVEKIVQKATAELTREIERQNKSLDESVKANKRQQDTLKDQIEHEKEMRKLLEEKIKISEQEAKGQDTVNVSTRAGTLATNALTIAVRSFITLGLGAVLAGLLIYWDDIKRAITGVTKEMELQNKVRDEAIGLYAEEKVHVENLWRESQNENTTKERTIEIINELNRLSPHFFGNIKTEKELHEQGTQAVADYIKALELKARAQAAQEIYVEELKVQMRMEQQSVKENASAWAYWGGTILENLADGAVGLDVYKGKISRFFKDISDDAAMGLYASSAAKNLKDVEESTSRAFKVMEDALNEVSALNEKGPFAPKTLKENSKEYLAILESFLQQRKIAELESINDETQQALQAEEVRFSQEKRAVQQRVLEFKGSKVQRAELVKAANSAIEELESAHLVKLAAITLKAIEADRKKEEEAENLIGALRKKSLDQQLIDIEKKYSDINDKIAAGGKLSNAIEKELEEAKNKEIAAIEQKHALEALNRQEGYERSRIAIMEVEGLSQNKLTLLREQKDLETIIEFALKKIAILKASGDPEDAVKANALIKAVADARGKLEGMAKEDGIDLFDLFGIEDPDKLMGGIGVLSKAAEQVGDLFGQIADSYQLAIDKKQEQVDSFSDQIKQLERELDKERALQEKGFASNVSLKERELAAAKAQKDEVLKEQEDLMQKQQAMQRAQILADSFAQTSDLVSSSASIFKQATKYLGPAGVPVAVLAIGAMIGAFAVAKANALKAVSVGQKFEHGGEFVLDGPSHAQGGLGVYDERTGRRVAEVEGGEGFFATNKKSTKKHRGLLEAINNDNFKDFHKFSASLDEILDHAGISFDHHNEIAKVVVVAQENSSRESEYKGAMISLSQNSDFLSSIARSNKEMLNIEKNKSEMLDMGDSILIKKGNVTRIIKKKDAV